MLDLIDMTKLEELRRHLRPGHVYRRQDLARWTNTVDRHLKQLVDEGTLRERAMEFDLPRLKRAALAHGHVQTQKFFAEALAADM